MHARFKAIGAVTLLLLTFGTGAIGEDSVSQDLPLEQTVAEPTIEPTTQDQTMQFSIPQEDVTSSSVVPHVGCPAGFETFYMVTPHTLTHPDGYETNYWPTCEWFHDDREFPGCPSYGVEVLTPPICLEHRNQNEK